MRAGQWHLTAGHTSRIASRPTVPLFPTPSGKIELYSSLLKQLSTGRPAPGFDPLPQYTPVTNPPIGHFRLLYGRSPVHSFARTQNNALLNSLEAENELWINAREARDLGLRDAQRVVLVNEDGVKSLPLKLFATEGIRRDCVYMAHGFGSGAKGLRRAYGRGASDNALMSRVQVDPIMGGTGMRVTFVRVLRAEG